MRSFQNKIKHNLDYGTSMSPCKDRTHSFVVIDLRYNCEIITLWRGSNIQLFDNNEKLTHLRRLHFSLLQNIPLWNLHTLLRTAYTFQYFALFFWDRHVIKIILSMIRSLPFNDFGKSLISEGTKSRF